MYLAEKYTPEWKFSPDNPDAGTALACVFAHRMSETIERFNKMPLNHKRQFYNMLGASALPAVPASGYILFNLNGINESNSFIEKGFKLFSPAIDEQGTRLIYETQQSALITTAKLKKLFTQIVMLIYYAFVKTVKKNLNRLIVPAVIKDLLVSDMIYLIISIKTADFI